MDLDYGILLGSLGFLTGSASLVYARSTARGTHRAADAADRARQEAAAMNVISTFHTPEFASLIIMVQNMTPFKGPDDFRNASPDMQRGLATLTLRMEMVGVLVADRIIDIELVEKTLGSFVVLAWEKMRPGAEGLRNMSGDPTASEYFQWLAERLEERQHTRAPAYVELKDWKAHA